MFSDQNLAIYFERMVGRIYKILPLKESEEDTVGQYIDSLLVEMTGLDILEQLNTQAYYTSIVSIVAYLNENVDACDIAKIRREIFKAINLCKKLQRLYQGGGSK